MTGIVTPLVGRVRELSRLSAALTDASAGLSSWIVVEGAPGIGKSALVEHFLRLHPAVTTSWAAGARWESRYRYGVCEQLLRTSLSGGDQVDAARALLGSVTAPRSSSSTTRTGRTSNRSSLSPLRSGARGTAAAHRHPHHARLRAGGHDRCCGPVFFGPTRTPGSRGAAVGGRYRRARPRTHRIDMPVRTARS
ncbi:AAA family ATPase [Rhodococcus hoagii]|nr:AAA family ATPase [Prescottella equi]